MSYDTYIRCPHCSGGEWVGNYTGNVSIMFARAMPARPEMPGRYRGTGEPEPGRAGLIGLSGMPVRDAMPILDEGIRYMEVHADELRELNPANGWGNYDGALNYLRAIRDACAEEIGDDTGTVKIVGVSW